MAKRKMSFKKAAKACRVKTSRKASKKFWDCVKRKTRKSGKRSRR